MTRRELNELKYGDIVINVITKETRTVNQTFANCVSLKLYGESNNCCLGITENNMREWKKK